MDSRQQRRYQERKERKMNKASGGPMLIKGGVQHKEIVGDDALREKKCLAEINQVLQRYDCVLVPKMIPTIAIAATPRGPSN